MNGAIRAAGRALVVDRGGRVLLIRGIDPMDPTRRPFWFTPGGGLDPGESPAGGTIRELREELGLEVDQVGPVVLHRRATFPFAGEVIVSVEVFHLVEVEEAFEPMPAALSDLERDVITGFRWMSADDVRSLEEDSYPRALASLLDHLGAHGAPDPPWEENLSGEE